MRRLAWLVGLVMLATGASAVAEQRAPGTRPGPVDREERPFEESRAVQTMHDYAECVVRRRRPQVVRMLEQAPGSPQERRVASAIASVSGTCLISAAPGNDDMVMLRFSPRLMRGSLVEALFKRDFDGVSPRNASVELARLPRPEAPADLPADIEDRELLMMLSSGFGSCMAERHGDGVMHILQTEPASEAEGAAFRQLAPEFGPCLNAGATITFNHQMLRGVLAEALYRHLAEGVR